MNKTEFPNSRNGNFREYRLIRIDMEITNYPANSKYYNVL